MVRGEAATSNWTVYTLQNQAQPELERKKEKGRERERKEERKKLKCWIRIFLWPSLVVRTSVCSSTTFLSFYTYKNNFSFGGASYN